MYDVEGPFGISVRRATFLIDVDRTIYDAVLADVRIGRHMAFIQEAIALSNESNAAPSDNNEPPDA